MGQVLLDALTNLCLSGPVLLGVITIYVLAIWILTWWAWHLRRQAARGNADEILTQNLLYLFAPLLLILALFLFLLAQVLPLILAILLVLALLPLLLLAPLILLIDYLPEIIQYILEHLGQLGERILTFITRSPNFPIRCLSDFWQKAIIRAKLFLSRHPRLGAPRRRLLRRLFSLLGLNSGAILLTAASNPRISLSGRIQAVHGLTRLGEVERLRQLARDPANPAALCVCAAQALESLGQNDQAAQAWHALAQLHEEAVYRLQAAQNLLRLGRMGMAIRVLSKYLSEAKEVPKFSIQAAKLLGLAGETNQALPILQYFLSSSEPRLRLKAAEGLCALSQKNTEADSTLTSAVETLKSLASDSQLTQSLRLTAIAVLEHYHCIQALSDLASQPEMEAKIIRQAARALQRLGKVQQAAKAWRNLAYAQTIPLELRLEAAEAFGTLTGNTEICFMLLKLAREESNSPQQNMQIAQTLHCLGNCQAAEILLCHLIENPDHDRQLHEEAQRALQRVRSTPHERGQR